MTTPNNTVAGRPFDLNPRENPERARFEEWYTTHAFDYAANPIGSRDCDLQWRAWKAALASPAPSAGVVDDDLLRWVKAQADDPDANPRFRELAAALSGVSAPVGVEERVRGIIALLRQPEPDNGEKYTEFDEGYDQASSEIATMLEAALASPAPSVPMRDVAIGAHITVAELARKLEIKGGEAIKSLFKMGVMATYTQEIDYNTAALLAAEYGWRPVLDAPPSAPPSVAGDAGELPELLQWWWNRLPHLEPNAATIVEELLRSIGQCRRLATPEQPGSAVQGEAPLSPNSGVWTSLEIILASGQLLKDKDPLMAADIIGHVQQIVDALEPLTTPPPAPAAEHGDTFQHGVEAWMGECFPPNIVHDRTERGDRLLEEVLELLQSHGYDRNRVATLVDYVYGRPVGEPAQEVGGVMVTLAAYCMVAGLNMHDEGDRELARITQPEVMAKIRRKQEAKNALHFDTPLPGNAATQPEARGVEDLPAQWDEMASSYAGDVRLMLTTCAAELRLRLAATPNPVRAEQPDCRCVDCGGDQPSHDPTCSYMRELVGEQPEGKDGVR